MPGTLFMAQERERVTLDLLRRHGAFPLADKRILDVGCGAGKRCCDFFSTGLSRKTCSESICSRTRSTRSGTGPSPPLRSGRRSATAVRGRHDGSRTCVHPLQRDSEPFDSRRRGRGDAPSAQPVRCSARARLLDDRSGQPGQSAATTQGDGAPLSRLPFRRAG